MSSSSLMVRGTFEDAFFKTERTEVPGPAEVSPGVTGFLWAIVLSGPLWLLIGVAMWYASGVI